MTTRYPFSALAAAMGVSPRQAMSLLRLSGSTLQRYRSEGVPYLVADRLALRAGLSTWEVWPSWHDDALEAARERRRAIDRRSKAKWRATEQGAELNRARRRAYYAANNEYEKARERRAYAARRGAA